MGQFRYSAYGKDGRFEGGLIEALERDVAIEQLRSRRLLIYEVIAVEAEVAARRRHMGRRLLLSRSELASLSRDWASLISADLPLTEVLRISAAEGSTKRVRAVSSVVLSRLREGSTLSAACAADGTLPQYITGLLAAGEDSGSLAVVVDEVAKHLERENELRGRLLSALIYPAILLLTAVGAVATCGAVLVPTIAGMLRDSGRPLPFAVAAIEGTTGFVEQNWATLLLGVAIAVSGVVAASRNPKWPMLRDRILLRLPLVGELLVTGELVKFARTLRLLIANGVPLLAGLGVVREISTNRVVSAMIGSAIEQVKGGAPFHVALREGAIFPQSAVSMMASGEHTGQLDAMLGRVADLFDGTLQRRLDRFVALASPVLTLGIGAGVGLLVLSIMDAILSLNDIALQ